MGIIAEKVELINKKDPIHDEYIEKYSDEFKKQSQAIITTDMSG